MAQLHQKEFRRRAEHAALQREDHGRDVPRRQLDRQDAEAVSLAAEGQQRMRQAPQQVVALVQRTGDDDAARALAPSAAT